ncbi:hypothetical protein ACXAT3_001987 [Clostridium sporogenes]
MNNLLGAYDKDRKLDKEGNNSSRSFNVRKLRGTHGKQCIKNQY